MCNVYKLFDVWYNYCMENTKVKKKKKETRQKLAEGQEHHYDLRRDLAFSFYSDPESDSFNNAMKSAIKAGYSESTARSITMENWWRKRVENLAKMLPRAEEIFIEDMYMETRTPIIIDGVTLYKIEPQLRRIRHESATFVAETVGKKVFSKKITLQHTGKVSLLNESLDTIFDEEGEN